MRTPFIILAIFMIASACKKATTEERCTPEKFMYTYEPGRQIDIQKKQPQDSIFEFYSYTLTPGDKNVFNFTWQFQDCPEIADDEGARIIVFEAPATGNSFLIRDSADLRKANALLNYSCYCFPSGPTLITGGVIDGKKTGNKWHIKAALKRAPNSSEMIHFEADFLMK